MTTKQVRVHCGIQMLGRASEVTNLNLEHRSNNDADEAAGNIWYNDTQCCIEYAETNDVVRRIMSDIDLEDLSKSIALKDNINARCINAKNISATSMVFGQPVFSASALEVDFANSTTDIKYKAIGLVSDASIVASGTGRVTTYGILIGTDAQWKAVTDNGLPLVPNTIYYLDITNGKITSNIAKSGSKYCCKIGRAITTTDFLINIDVGVSNTISNGVTIKQKLKGTVGMASGTNTLIPFDNTAPLPTEGTQLWSCTIKPTSVDSNIVIDFSGIVDVSKINVGITLAIFRNNQLLSLLPCSSSGYNAGFPAPFSFKINDKASVTDNITYSCRIGTSTNATWYLGRSASHNHGGANNSHWSVTEEL